MAREVRVGGLPRHGERSNMPTEKSKREKIEAARTELADRLAAGEITEEEAAELDAKLIAQLGDD